MKKVNNTWRESKLTGNVQFDKLKGYAEGVREGYKEEVVRTIDKLLSLVTEAKSDLENGADYIETTTNLMKLYITVIEDRQSIMSAMDSVLQASERIQENFPNEDKNKIYWYTYRLRGFSIGCQPSGFIKHDDSIGRHGAVAYDRELTEEEISEYELDFLKVEAK